MAELTDTSTPTSSCCSTEAQSTCCEHEAKDACCGTAAAGGSCGCAEGQPDVRDVVRERYAAAARAAASSQGNCRRSAAVSLTDEEGEQVFGASLYANEADTARVLLEASLGCGVPTAVADLHEGETVLDLGSGAGGDVLISAGRVGPTGRAIGLDMTDEMLDLARSDATDAGISNCVINLSGDKPRVIREVARVLKPGGRFAVSDVIADPDMDDATRADMAAWTGCIAWALTRDELEHALTAAGLIDTEISETHRVHRHAASAIIRATKPTA